MITKPHEFLRLVREAEAAVSAGRFVLFGITPSRPETGFGYIVPETTTSTVNPIARFVEKPPEDSARDLISKGAQWNSGIFFYTPQTLCDEATKLAPRSLELCKQALRDSSIDLGCTILSAAPYAQIGNDPFDRLIMEKTLKGSVVPGDFGWSDVGSWHTLWQTDAQNGDGNVTKGPVIVKNVQSSYLRSYGPTLAVMGLDNVAVVATKDAVLVTPLSRAQEIRDLVAMMDASDSTLGVEHPRVMRPWGFYETIAAGSRFQVKQITVLPGRSLSRQMHHHRAEHWVVVTGTAKVECDGKEQLLHPNESVFIPLGSVHRLSNPGMVDLNLIEVQSGDYVGEDDIVRFADNYGRN